MVFAFFIGLLVIQSVGVICQKCVIDNLIKKEIKAESSKPNYYTPEELLKFHKHYGNLVEKSLFWMRIVSMFIGGIVVGYIIGRSGWKLATVVILLLFPLQDFPVRIQELANPFLFIQYSSHIVVLFGVLGGVIGSKLKLGTEKWGHC